MYCGSCLHDNALARALTEQGWNVQLVPTYTPIRTDEEDVSVDQVLFGGLNVFLQQKIPLFRHLPMFVDRFLDSPRLIRRATAKSIDTDAATLGSLALSMLKGLKGNQRKEVRRLCQWLGREQPDLIVFTNLLIGGCLEAIKNELKVPVLVTLQGDDVFLNGLQSPWREQCMTQIRTLVPYVDGFIAHSQFYRDEMSEYFDIPPEKIHVTPLGIDVRDYKPFLNKPDQSPHENRDRTIGYLARIAPEKGVQHLAEAFIRLKQMPQFADVKLKIAGWLGAPNIEFANTVWQRLNDAGLSSEYKYLGSPDREAKLSFLRSIEVLCVPTDFREPKGLYALEAMAAGIPVVVPDHGAFPELIAQSEGGWLFQAGDIDALASSLGHALSNGPERRRLAQQGQTYVHEFRNEVVMAERMGELMESFLGN